MSAHVCVGGVDAWDKCGCGIWIRWVCVGVYVVDTLM